MTAFVPFFLRAWWCVMNGKPLAEGTALRIVYHSLSTPYPLARGSFEGLERWEGQSEHYLPTNPCHLGHKRSPDVNQMEAHCKHMSFNLH